ncbi:flagellin [Thioalkalivibrio sulfidiphilus]|uniref:flagellin N-terminal helical domain-containing protein n=1 Tax=Thioalkalivibrio sulfidiphilus TaxID=1033854 RepID=UPI00037E621B|nr:flagellin [Thioalkalivibrio sulfidiphilus]
MAQIINTNVLSLNAQRNLTNSQSALQASLQRLSSGLRINSAKDDAAGLAISERFTTQIRGTNQAIRNANDGISFAQTAEGALSTVGDALQRMRELAVQSANDSNSASDRQALNNEVQQLIAEIVRVANATEFNGQRVLDGSLQDLFFQVGANQGQTIAVSGVDARTTQLGASEVAGVAGLTQTQINDVGIASIADIAIDFDGTVSTILVDMTGVTSLEDAVREINSAIRTGAAVDTVISDANLTASLRVDNEGNTTIVINGKFEENTEDTALFTVEGGAVELADGDPDADPAVSGTVIELFGDQAVDSTQVNLTELNVSTRMDAFKTIAAVDGALTQINGLRAELGSVQIRFENTIANLGVSAENLAAARSRIRDADFAAETAELTRAQILQQAGISVLAQANAVPQSVLALLQ